MFELLPCSYIKEFDDEIPLYLGTFSSLNPHSTSLVSSKMSFNLANSWIVILEKTYLEANKDMLFILGVF